MEVFNRPQISPNLRKNIPLLLGFFVNVEKIAGVKTWEIARCREWIAVHDVSWEIPFRFVKKLCPWDSELISVLQNDKELCKAIHEQTSEICLSGKK